MAVGRKTGGRQKGTPNATTAQLRTVVKLVLSEEMNEWPEILKALDPHSRMGFGLKLLEMAIPKPAPISEGADKAQEDPDPLFEYAEKAMRDRFTEFNP